MLRMNFTFFLLMACMLTAQGQDEIGSLCVSPVDTVDGIPVHKTPTLLPEFPGGNNEMLRHISTNLRYTNQETLQGTIYITCIIDTSGKVRNACVLKGFSNEGITPLEKEALRVFDSMPRWKPGAHEGKAVPVKLDLPIKIGWK